MHPALTSIALAFALAVAGSPAWAHGIPKPRHGGLVDVGGEISFELLAQQDQLVIFVEDHGKPVDTRGATGELLQGAETGPRLALLKGAGHNSVAGPLLRLRVGQRVFVRLALRDGSTVVGEFRIAQPCCTPGQATSERLSKAVR